MSADEVKMSSAAFSQYVKGLDDLYNLAMRNDYFLPKRSSSAINENMLTNVLLKKYWCPLYTDIKMRPCVKAPVKDTLNEKLQKLCKTHKLNIGWIDVKTMPNKDWMVAVIATLNP